MLVSFSALWKKTLVLPAMENIDKIHILSHMYWLYKHKTFGRRDYIYEVGTCYGIEEKEIVAALAKPPPLPAIDMLSETEKFEIVYVIVQFMKLEKRICSQELQFCEGIAATLGYRTQLITELCCYVYSDPAICTKREVLWDIFLFYAIENR